MELRLEHPAGLQYFHWRVCSARESVPFGSRPGGSGYCSAWWHADGRRSVLSISSTRSHVGRPVVLIKPSCDEIHYPTPPRWSRARRRIGADTTESPPPTERLAGVAANKNRYHTNSIPISDTDVARVNVIVAAQICNSLSAINNGLRTS